MATFPTAPPGTTALSETPNRATDTPSQFSDKTNTFLNELDPFRVEQNTQSGWSHQTAQQVYNNAVEAEQSKTAAEQAALNAANYQGLWADATGASTVPASYFHDGFIWIQLVNLADITLSEPSGTNPDWFNPAYDERYTPTYNTAAELAANNLGVTFSDEMVVQTKGRLAIGDGMAYRYIVRLNWPTALRPYDIDLGGNFTAVYDGLLSNRPEVA